MNSRERVVKAVNFKRPDRIPIDLGSIRASGINAVVYDKLKSSMGVKTPTKIYSDVAMLAEVEVEVLDLLHADVLPLDVANITWTPQKAQQGVKRKLFSGLEVYFAPSTDIREVSSDGSWLLYDSQGKPVARMPKDGYYFDYLKHTMFGKSIDQKKFNPAG